MTDKNTAALAAHHPENHLDMVGRWYMLNKMGMATLCASKADAQQEAADAQRFWPHMGPHRAVRLIEASFEAADMATAAAQGFRDGVASVAASAPAPSAHIKEPYTLAEIKAKIASNDYSAEMLLQHAMLLLDSASLAASVGEPVAWLVCTEEGDPDMVFLDRLEACQYCEDDDPPKPLYLAAPPTAQAEGWRLVPVEPTQKMLFVAMNAFVAASASLGAFNAPDAAYRALLAAAPTHPTSSVVVEHG